MSKPWKAPAEVVELMEDIREKYHLPRLEGVSIAVALKDDKPFVKNRMNFGKVSKVSPSARIWMREPHDFCITLCADVWMTILNPQQREALLDLHLSCCEPVYEPETIIENKKKIVIKDEYGRVKYTDDVKLDKDGAPVWQVVPADLVVIGRNVRRFGLWFADLEDFARTVNEAKVA